MKYSSCPSDRLPDSSLRRFSISGTLRGSSVVPLRVDLHDPDLVRRRVEVGELADRRIGGEQPVPEQRAVCADRPEQRRDGSRRDQVVVGQRLAGEHGAGAAQDVGRADQQARPRPTGGGQGVEPEMPAQQRAQPRLRRGLVKIRADLSRHWQTGQEQTGRIGGHVERVACLEVAPEAVQPGDRVVGAARAVQPGPGQRRAKCPTRRAAQRHEVEPVAHGRPE